MTKNISGEVEQGGQATGNIGTKDLVSRVSGNGNVARRHRIEEPELLPLMRAATFRLHKLIEEKKGDGAWNTCSGCCGGS